MTIIFLIFLIFIFNNFRSEKNIEINKFREIANIPVLNDSIIFLNLKIKEMFFSQAKKN